jgi:hypothetical protein
VVVLFVDIKGIGYVVLILPFDKLSLIILKHIL